MLKVILIDDEAVILHGLRKLIDWNMLGFEIVAEAGDGKMALKLIEEKKVDIVISDISMPNLSGIELLREIQNRNWKVKTILLSGYQEFTYAREAVRYRAVDYLLKPVSAEELTHVLTMVADSIHSERSYHKLRKKDSKTELIFQELLCGKTEEMTVRDLACEAGLAMEHTGAVGVAFRILWNRDRVNSEENLSLIMFKIYELIELYMEQKHTGCIIKKEYGTCYCILSGDHERNKLKNSILNLKKEIQSNYPIELIAGVGEWSQWDGKLKHAYVTARFALELYYFVEQLYIEYEEISKEYVHSLEEYEEKVKHLIEGIILSHDLQELVEEILGCVTLLGNIHFGNKNTVINSCIMLSGELFSTLQSCGLIDESYMDEQEEFLEKVRTKTTFRGLQSLFSEYYKKLFLRIHLLRGMRKSSEISRVKCYIGEHFKENITLEDIANYIGMNTTYMSVFFKKETGKNFKGYLTEVRMKEAIRLLNSTDMKSYELAAAIGYRDDKQFREKFREMYGVSPQQYRKQLR